MVKRLLHILFIQSIQKHKIIFTLNEAKKKNEGGGAMILFCKNLLIHLYNILNSFRFTILDK